MLQDLTSLQQFSSNLIAKSGPCKYFLCFYPQIPDQIRLVARITLNIQPGSPKFGAICMQISSLLVQRLSLWGGFYLPLSFSEDRPQIRGARPPEEVP